MKNVFTLLLTVLSTMSMAQIGWMATFESIDLTKTDTFWNGSDESGGFLNGEVFFKNNYNTAWKSWDGVAVSNMTDSTTEGFVNQYSARTAHGVNFTNNYAVIGGQGVLVLTDAQQIEGCYVTNSTYSSRSMEKGDPFAKKFGGVSGNDSDYFRIIAKGYQGTSVKTTSFYLADFRSTDNSQDYIISDWTYFNLSVLGSVDSITFSMESSDTGQFGMNTPAFFCLDHLNADSVDPVGINNLEMEGLIGVDTFENGSNYDGGFKLRQSFFVNEYNKDWNSWSGWSISSKTDTSTADFTNQYSAITGKGFDDSKTYLTGYERTTILFPYTDDVRFNSLKIRTYNVYVTNSTYAYKTMLDGNNFAKKFGGVSGDDKDYLVLKAVATDDKGNTSDTVEHYLADFRFDDNSRDYISSDWTLMELRNIMLGKPVVRLDFWIEGSDTGQFGLNTPGYFCMDHLFPVEGSIKTQKKINVTVYPNPTTSKIYFDTETSIVAVKVYDLTGKLQLIETGSHRFFDFTNLVNGVYTLLIKTEQGETATKFIKQ